MVELTPPPTPPPPRSSRQLRGRTFTQPHFVYSDRYISEIGVHVFPMDKYQRVAKRLQQTPGMTDHPFVEPRPATREELELVHDPAYLDDLFQLRMTNRTAPSELPLNQSIVDLSVLSTGGTLVAADLALSRGWAYHIGGGWHHAFPGHAEGFCYLNDTAVAIRKVKKDQRLTKVAVVDLDLHQGNGTAGIFRRDPTVFTFSMHQEHLYPIKQHSTLDIGLEEYTTDETYLGLLEPALDRIFGEFFPELVFYLAGADPYEHDQLGLIKFTLGGLERRDRMVLERCQSAKVPVVVLLAGGYAVDSEDTVKIHTTTALVMGSVLKS